MPKITGESTPASLLIQSIPDALPVDAPAAPALPFPVVSIGASAGGVEALMRLFSLVPRDTGCAFMAIMHLAPDRESLLVPLIRRGAKLPVLEAHDGMALERDHIYVAPPGSDIMLDGGRFVLEAQRPDRRGAPHAIDRFMVSLAAAQRQYSVGVVLSGADGDGSLGIKAIKSEGGLTLAQLPSSAAHPDMPLSAISTGLIDRQLPLEEMPEAINEFARTLVGAEGRVAAGDSLRTILELVLAKRGMDFRLYKSAMLRRRVVRRMGLARIREMDQYVDLLKRSEAELRGLCQDFLIGVTEFFREPEAWRYLATEVLPPMLAAKGVGEPFRVWVPACSTGEEAYTMAMVLLDRGEVAERALRVQIFATDIDAAALEVARKGIYPATIEKAVGPELLRRFFVPSGGGFQVSKELRDAVMFAPQNLVTDPPFSRIDVVSCRNLMIYVEPALQRWMLNLFHFALEPNGVLFLGKSETVGSQLGQFAPLSPRERIYRKVGPSHPLSMPLAYAGQPARDPPRPRAVAPRRDYGHILRSALVDHRIAAAVLTTREGEILYAYGPLQQFVSLPEGPPSNDLFTMLREQLRPQVRAALHKAASDDAPVETTAELRGEGGNGQTVRIVVSAIPPADEGVRLVTFERVERGPRAEIPADSDDSGTLLALEEELRNTKRELRSTIEELESANEELKVSNEEAMSMNEELQSTNEELETSKEELQSVNEELTTVNSRLNEKVFELEAVNDDLGNLLSSTHIATLFLDRDLRIKRFTPAATQLYSLIATDVNRPVTDIASRVEDSDLATDARRVLAELAPVEREVFTADGAHFLRRTLPYRTSDDRIEGLVVTFVEITQLRRAVQEARRLAAVLQSSSDAIVVHDMAGRIVAWNRGAATMYGHSEEQMLGTPVARLVPEGASEAFEAAVRRLRGGERMASLESLRRRADGSEIAVSCTMSLVPGEGGGPDSIASIERDVSESKAAEARLRESEQRFRLLADSAPVIIFVADAAGGIAFANREFAQFTGRQPEDLLGRRWWELLELSTPEDRSRCERASAQAQRLDLTARLRSAGGEWRWVKVTATPRSAEGGAQGMIGSMVDVDAQVSAERAMRDSNVRKDEFLAMLSHELRNPLVPVKNAAAILRRIGNEDPRLQWVADTLVTQVGHVTRLVDDLLDISRVARGVLRLERQPVDMAFVLERSMESAHPMIERKAQKVVLRAPREPLWVEGDAIRLVQVFSNLLVNASKYSEEGGKIVLDARRDGTTGVFRVIDEGIGISPEMQARIFDLFVQDARAVDRSEGGLGVGLSLVQHLVLRHQGTVSAHSEGLGKGSEFVVRLPLLNRGRPAAAAAKRQQGPVPGFVLLVDDDPEAGRSTAEVLRLDGFDVAHVGSARAAIAACKERRPDVMVLDITMPEMDGFALIAKLRELLPGDGTAYYALTGFGRDDDRERTARAGFARHFVKPVDLDELSAALRAQLTKRAPS